MQEKPGKTCSKCKEAKPLKEFHKRSGVLDGRRSACKICECKKRIEYHFKNHEKSICSSKAWKQNNQDKVKEYSKKYYSDNKETLTLKKREYNLNSIEKRRAYRLKNKDRYAMHKATRRFLEKASSVYNDEFNSFVIEECYSLARLRSDITGIKWHVDHILPLNGKTVCGLHVGINLQVIPATTNLRKSNSHE